MSVTTKTDSEVLDPYRKLSLDLIQKSWKGLYQEYHHWVPQADIEGTIPNELYGTIFRNGPGIDEIYGKKISHPIDGDGLICALSFIDGKVHFRCKFVNHQARVLEAYHRKIIYRGQMGTQPHHWTHDLKQALKGVITGSRPKFYYRNPSNTNVFYHGGKLLSCYETSLPHSLDPFTLNTIGPDNLNGSLKLKSLAAHFRFDPISNRLVTISIRPGLNGNGVLQINEYDNQFKLVYSNELHIPNLNYAHDFLITPRYYIFHITPFVKVTSWLIFRMAAGLDSPGEQMKYYPDLPSQIVVITRPTVDKPIIQIPEILLSSDPKNKPKNTNSNSNNTNNNVTAKNKSVRIFDIPPCHIYHFGSCYEEFRKRGKESSNDDNLLNKQSKKNEERSTKKREKVKSIEKSTSDKEIENNESDEDEMILFNAVCLGPKFNMNFDSGVWLSNASVEPGLLYGFTINLTKGSVQRSEPLDKASVEFPTIHPFRHGLPCRYTYMMAADLEKRPGAPLPYRDIVKYDSDINGVRSVWHSYGCVGEPLFIPRDPLDLSKNSEDDGWLFVQLYVPEKHLTDFVILDAKNVSKGPVAIIHMKTHIPNGFHGTYSPIVFLNETGENINHPNLNVNKFDDKNINPIMNGNLQTLTASDLGNIETLTVQTLSLQSRL